MSTVIHVPEKYDQIDDLERLANEYDLSLKYLESGSKSFKIFGSEENISKYVAEISKFNKDDIYAILSVDKTKIIRPHIQGIRLLKEDLAKEDLAKEDQVKEDQVKEDPAKEHHLTNHVYPSHYSAKELAAIYNLNGAPTKRVGIAIIELGGGFKSSDLNTYWNFLGLTIKPNVYSIAVNGVSNTPGSDADGEVVLDIEVVGGICPNSNIYVYFAPNSDSGFYNAIHAAIYSTTHPVSVISISWGGPESTWSPSTLQAFNNLFKQASDKGITVTVASGDNGSSDGIAGGNHVDFPSASPWVLACGGTRLNAPNKIYDKNTTEIVWGTYPGNGASGGGFSTVFPRPPYQTTLTSKYTQFGRCVPDIASNADPATGWLIYLNGQYQVFGGTSAVAPMWAAYLASIGFNKFVNPILYSLYQSNRFIVHDIVVGNEGTYSAAAGFDIASGLGSPNGYVLTPFLKQYV